MLSTINEGNLSHQDPQADAHRIRIGFDAKRAFYNKRGLGNYSRNLIEAMVKLDERNEYFLFTPKTKNRIILDRLTEDSINIIAPRRFHHRAISSLWRSKFITGDIKKNRIDIYHGLSHELPYGIKVAGVKAVVTVHDLIFIRYPDFYGPINVYIYRKKLEYACKMADKIVAISSQTRDDLIRFIDAQPGKIEVIAQSCNPSFSNKISGEEYRGIKTKYLIPDNYLLYVGAIEERKNLIGILKAMHEKAIKTPLVVIGNKTPYYQNIIQPFILKNKMDNIIFPEGIRNEELPALYQNAQSFIYPSFFEGFGIPILEALTTGIPVITSKGSCFEETGGGGSIYIDPGNPGEIGDAILRVSGDHKLRSEMIEKGYEHAKLFSPAYLAQKYLDLYRTILK